MKNKILYILVVIISFISCKTEKKPKNEIVETPKNERIDSLGNRYLELGRFSGVILINKEDTIIYNQNFGFADYQNNISFSNNTSFKIGKISELISTNILREMAKDNRIQLSDKFSKYIPEINSESTIKDFLNYKTNLVNQSSDKFVESNLDNYSLEFLIEKISGKNFPENIEEYSKDLGLKNTNFRKVDSNLAVGYLYHNYQGNGLELQKSPISNSKDTLSDNVLKSTANDLTRILNSNSANEVAIDGYLENDGFSYSITHNPKNKISIVVLSNRKHPVAKEISNSIVSILEDKEYRIPLARKQFDIDKELLKEYSGFYSLNEEMNFEVLNENDSLFVMMGPNKIHLIPQSENQFYMEQMDASMRFLRDTNNKVEEVVLLDGFLDGNKIKRTEK
jgi:CubicO group peptidase (beta-lactamase class C family)